MNEQYAVDAAEGRLRKAGIRTTRARRLVLETLDSHAGPKTAEELTALLPDVPVSSLYRTLSVLSSTGVLQRIHDGAGKARYEMAEWITGHHHHITCVECGRTEDIDFPSAAETEIDRIAEQAAGAAGFAVEGHRLDLEGICEQCR